jgi:hypothetical protein
MHFKPSVAVESSTDSISAPIPRILDSLSPRETSSPPATRGHLAYLLYVLRTTRDQSDTVSHHQLASSTGYRARTPHPTSYAPLVTPPFLPVLLSR